MPLRLVVEGLGGLDAFMGSDTPSGDSHSVGGQPSLSEGIAQQIEAMVSQQRELISSERGPRSGGSGRTGPNLGTRPTGKLSKHLVSPWCVSASTAAAWKPWARAGCGCVARAGDEVAQ